MPYSISCQQYSTLYLNNLYLYFASYLTEIAYVVLVSVDNDPHFIVLVRGLEEGVCFDVDGTPGDTFQLIYDGVSGTCRHLTFQGGHSQKTCCLKPVSIFLGVKRAI